MDLRAGVNKLHSSERSRMTDVHLVDKPLLTIMFRNPYKSTRQAGTTGEEEQQWRGRIGYVSSSLLIVDSLHDEALASRRPHGKIRPFDPDRPLAPHHEMMQDKVLKLS